MSSSPDSAARYARQSQFLEVVSRDEAEARFRKHLRLEPLGIENVPLGEALHRTLACDVIAPEDVPGFDRSNVDGFAVRSAETEGADEETPLRLRLNQEVLFPGEIPRAGVEPGTATTISTGGMIPRGADAVVMVEWTDFIGSEDPPCIEVRRMVMPGEQISFAGSDISRGETVLRRGDLLTSRELGVLAALGQNQVDVFRRPRVAILSTGNEIVAPGQPRPLAGVYDSNATILAAAVEELGGEPFALGAFPDELPILERALAEALQADVDMILISGGTSKGAGDLSHQLLGKLVDPGIVVHGVALKPGKPLCLAVTDGRPIALLPGFPTSAIFTFHEFVAPVIRILAGREAASYATVEATLPTRINSEKGRTEFLLVNLVPGPDGLAAYPLGKGSGSVTTFSTADGFISIPQHQEMILEGTRVQVQLLDRELKPADLVIIGSHCQGLDLLVRLLRERGLKTKLLHVGSTAGLLAAQRGECDLAGVHLLDEATGEYNRPFLTPGLELIPGYRRMQGILFRPDDPRFRGKSLEEIQRLVVSDSDCSMINRNTGSGTRILIDRFLQNVQPAGYSSQPKTHNAVASAIVQRRADWGVAIETIARQYALGFVPLQAEHYDFLTPRSRADRIAVRLFRELLSDPAVRQELSRAGFPSE
ncbi:MAG: molybdopterin biosynthesis protein [Planctomycetales bacterium]